MEIVVNAAMDNPTSQAKAAHAHRDRARFLSLAVLTNANVAIPILSPQVLVGRFHASPVPPATLLM